MSVVSEMLERANRHMARADYLVIMMITRRSARLGALREARNHLQEGVEELDRLIAKIEEDRAL